MRADEARPERSGTRFQQVAVQLAERIRSDVYPRESLLPSVARLAADFGVARGTVLRALEELESEQQLVARRGSRWYVHDATRPRDFDVLRSFGQWALASGLDPESRTIRVLRGRASSSEASQLQLRLRDPVLRIVRVRSLAGRPVMVERTTFIGRLADVIAALPVDVRSIMEAIEPEHGVSFARAEQRIGVRSAGAEDSRLLQVRKDAPLLQILRTVWSADGRPFECSDDRYVAGSIALTIAHTRSGAAVHD